MKIFIHFLFFVTIIYAGTTGKLSGVVYDLDTKEPIVGCNVVVQKGIGTATDEDGYFFIMNISPGSYDIDLA